jgi:hypothetical protein
MDAHHSHIWNLMGLGPQWVLKAQPDSLLAVNQAQGDTLNGVNTAVFGAFEVGLDSASNQKKVVDSSGALLESMFKTVHWRWSDFLLCPVRQQTENSVVSLSQEVLSCGQWLVFGGSVASALGCSSVDIERAVGTVIECTLEGAQRRLSVFPDLPDLLSQAHAKAMAWKGLCAVRDKFSR